MQIAAKQPVDLVGLQRTRKAVLLGGILLCIGFLLFGTSSWPGGTFMHETIEWIGIMLILIAIVGRTWCALYIGGRKAQVLTDSGPYSICRNPLYVFSILGGAGTGAQLGSIVMALVAGLTTWFVFLLVVRKEEEALVTLLGPAYEAYVQRVPRFIPNFSLWRDVESITVRPSLIVMTFLDALVFSLSIPLAEGIEYLHEQGFLLALVQLP